MTEMSRAEAVYFAAAALPPADRAAYLLRACAGREDLRLHVERMLAVRAEVGSFLESGPPAFSLTDATAAFGAPPTDPPTATFDTSSDLPTADYPFKDEHAGMVIAGKYTFVEIIGEGGMGSVWRAKQTEPVKRFVAVKLIKAGMDSKQVLARFEAERQALALMDHPNITKVLDGGLHDGRPFFVMELVRGIPITDYCDKCKLTPRKRLELFVAVCQAIQHAHQKGIIHRDIKPSNVLIALYDDKPVVKVIDFGVAKATGGALTERTIDTGFGGVVGTPQYMSPEQATFNNLDIDTRSDVYALGVLLYELLAGAPPFTLKELEKKGLLELLRVVREEEPPRPSTKLSTSDALPTISANRGTESKKLTSLLRNELDWIVMKALEKDRARRYETANDFAADVFRYLSGEAVQAHPPSMSYRLKKFVRRNKGQVIAASLVLFALLGGVVGTTLAMFEAKREAERAVLAEAETEKKAKDIEYRLHVSDFVAARTAYDMNDLAQSVEHLDKVPLAQRGWEWHYLKQLTRGGLFTLYGHMGEVSSVAFSRDGTRIVTGCFDRTAKVWDAKTGTSLLDLKDQSGDLKGLYGRVSSVAFSPDGTRIVTGCFDRTAKVWDAKNGTSLLDLKGHIREVTSVAFSLDGTRIATGSMDGTAKVWDAKSGTFLLDLKSHMGGVTSVAFSPDGTRIVTGSSRTAKVWEAKTGTFLLDLKGHTGGEPHTGWVTSVAFSPDGTRIATGSKDGTAKVWDVKTGIFLLGLIGRTDGVTSVAFSPDGTRIVTGCFRAAKVWDARAGAFLLDLKGHTGWVTSVAFSPDGTRVATSSQDGTAKVWDTKADTSLLDLKGHTGWVTSVAFSPDETRIVTGSDDRTAKVWDAKTGTSLLDLKGHTGRVTSVVFSPVGTRIVTGSSDKMAKVWDTKTGTCLVDLKGHSAGVTSVVFSPDGTRIVTGSFDRAAKVWDARAGAFLLDLRGHIREVTSVAFSPDGTRIVTGSDDKTAKVWDAKTGTSLLDLKGHSAGVTSVAFSPDGMRIVTGSDDKTAKVWDAESGNSLLDLKGHTGAVSSVMFSSGGTRIVAGSGDDTAKVWDAKTGTFLLDLRGHTDRVTCVAYSPDGTRIVTSSQDGTAKVWDARAGTSLLDLEGHATQVSTVAFSQDGTRVATGSIDGTAKVWDARAGTSLLDLEGHTFPVTSVAFSLDGTRIVTASFRTAKVWDTKTGTSLLDLEGHSAGVTSVAFSPDGTRIVTGGLDRTAKVWDARAGTFLLDLKGHTGGVTSVAFSLDGTRIATGSDDKTAKMWDAKTGTSLLDLEGHTDRVTSVAFSPDGTRIVTGAGGDLGTGTRLISSAKVWDTKTGKELTGESIPLAPWPGVFSPDSRWFAHTVGNRVALIPLQPDEDELAYRKLVMQPNVWRYREGYESARAANDEFAARFYIHLLPPVEWPTLEGQLAKDRTIREAQTGANKAIAAGRTQDALVHLTILSAAKPGETMLFQQVAILQAWFGQDKELADTFGRAPAFAKDAGDPVHLAMICCLRPTQDKSLQEAALAFARATVEPRKNDPFSQLVLGMAEYRSGSLAEADAALNAAKQLGTTGTGAFYRAMSLFQQGEEAEARKLATTAAASMRPLPADEKNPLAGGADQDDLIMWLAYKEAKALIGFDTPWPVAPPPREKK